MSEVSERASLDEFTDEFGSHWMLSGPPQMAFCRPERDCAAPLGTTRASVWQRRGQHVEVRMDFRVNVPEGAPFSPEDVFRAVQAALMARGTPGL